MTLKNNKAIRQLVYSFRNFRDKFSYKSGKNNTIRNKGVRIACKIQVKGSNNLVQIESGVVCKHVLIRISGNNNRILIHKNAFVSGSELWIEDNGCLLEIGEKTFVGPSHLAVTEDGSKITIGADCMISSNVQIRSGDSHSIMTLNGERINPAESIEIGDHVWIGQGAKIMKGVTLEKDSIVSSGAIVTKSFSHNQLIGGVPAKVIKECVTWDKQRL